MNEKLNENKKSIQNNKDTIEEWKFNIERANEIVRLYEDQTKYFVKLTLPLITTYNILYAIFSTFFNPDGFIILTVSFIGYIISAIITLYLSLRRKASSKKFELEMTNCHYRDRFDKNNNLICEVPKDLSYEKFKEDYYLQLNNLFKYQKNYFERADIARKSLIISIFIFICGITVSLIVNFQFYNEIGLFLIGYMITWSISYFYILKLLRKRIRKRKEKEELLKNKLLEIKKVKKF